MTNKIVRARVRTDVEDYSLAESQNHEDKFLPAMRGTTIRSFIPHPEYKDWYVEVNVSPAYNYHKSWLNFVR